MKDYLPLTDEMSGLKDDVWMAGDSQRNATLSDSRISVPLTVRNKAEPPNFVRVGKAGQPNAQTVQADAVSKSGFPPRTSRVCYRQVLS